MKSGRRFSRKNRPAHRPKSIGQSVRVSGGHHQDTLPPAMKPIGFASIQTLRSPLADDPRPFLTQSATTTAHP